MTKETILYAAIMNAPRIIWNKDNLSMYQGIYLDEKIHCYEQLSVLEQYCHDNSGVLMEHVEMAAKYIFGENVSLEHEALRGKTLHLMEFAGIYVPAHVGGGNSVEPIILERHDFVDYYELIVAFGT